MTDATTAIQVPDRRRHLTCHAEGCTPPHSTGASKMNRRESLSVIAGATAAAATASLLDSTRASAQAQPAPVGPFRLPPLGYGYDALEPHIDTTTMSIHHD